MTVAMAQERVMHRRVLKFINVTVTLLRKVRRSG